MDMGVHKVKETCQSLLRDETCAIVQLSLHWHMTHCECTAWLFVVGVEVRQRAEGVTVCNLDLLSVSVSTHTETMPAFILVPLLITDSRRNLATCYPRPVWNYIKGEMSGNENVGAVSPR